MCFSQSLAKKMKAFTAHGMFLQMCKKIARPDDVTVAFIAEGILNVTLTMIDEFHSHAEPLKTRIHDLHRQISLSHKLGGDNNAPNLLTIKGFNHIDDPTR